MIFEVVIPNLGATGSDVVIDNWLVKPGDYVEAGRPLFVVSTDKATVEVEAFRNGYIREFLVEPGTRIPLGAVVALMTDDGPRKETGIPRILASPLARRLAREAGIPLENITGSGKKGQILRQDVQQAIDSQQRSESAFTGVGIEGKGVSVAVTGMRRSIAQRTQLSKSEIPHYYASVTIDMSEAKSFLSEIKVYAKRKGWSAPTITDLSIRAAALALSQSPQINASFQGEEIFYFDYINIGLVIGLPEGILVPVIHYADRKSLYTLAAMTTRLKEKVKTGTISDQDLNGGTFTISNLGMFGLDSFTAVINPPEAGILALGAVKQVPAVWNGQIVPRWLMTAVLSVDHRVVDGIVAARFLDEFRQLLEHPVVLTLAAPEDISE